jgi:hypothetical protein
MRREMGPCGGFFARATLEGVRREVVWDGEDIPFADEGVDRVEQAKEARVVDDFVSKEDVQTVGVGRDAGEQGAEDERGDTHWKG